jgi:hypothetical protein
MEIVEIYENWLYSIQFDEEELNEFERVFNEWHDLDYLENFFETHAEYLESDFWAKSGLHADTPNINAIRVIQEAENLEKYIKRLVKNTSKGKKPDLDTYFHFLDGKYKCVWTLEPVKSYGTHRPSLLRLYAIKLEHNCYLIVYGGIKLGETIQSSPVLKDHVFDKIDKVLNYLKANSISDREDI